MGPTNQGTGTPRAEPAEVAEAPRGRAGPAGGLCGYCWTPTSRPTKTLRRPSFHRGTDSPLSDVRPRDGPQWISHTVPRLSTVEPAAGRARPRSVRHPIVCNSPIKVVDALSAARHELGSNHRRH